MPCRRRRIGHSVVTEDGELVTGVGGIFGGGGAMASKDSCGACHVPASRVFLPKRIGSYVGRTKRAIRHTLECLPGLRTFVIVNFGDGLLPADALGASRVAGGLALVRTGREPHRGEVAFEGINLSGSALQQTMASDVRAVLDDYLAAYLSPVIWNVSL